MVAAVPDLFLRGYLPEADPDWLRHERAFIEGTRRGDREAFGALYRAHAPRLYRAVLLPRLGVRDAAEEALAETFRIALERIDTYADRGGSIYGWLSVIAANVATDMHRRNVRGERALTNLAALVPEWAADRPDAAHDEAARMQTLRSTTSAVLAAINPRYRKAIELRFIDARERVDCADAMELKLGTFDVLLLRALRAFRETWLAHTGAAPEL